MSTLRRIIAAGRRSYRREPAAHARRRSLSPRPVALAVLLTVAGALASAPRVAAADPSQCGDIEFASYAPLTLRLRVGFCGNMSWTDYVVVVQVMDPGGAVIGSWTQTGGQVISVVDTTLSVTWTGTHTLRIDDSYTLAGSPRSGQTVLIASVGAPATPPPTPAPTPKPPPAPTPAPPAPPTPAPTPAATPAPTTVPAATERAGADESASAAPNESVSASASASATNRPTESASPTASPSSAATESAAPDLIVPEAAADIPVVPGLAALAGLVIIAGAGLTRRRGTWPWRRT